MPTVFDGLAKQLQIKAAIKANIEELMSMDEFQKAYPPDKFDIYTEESIQRYLQDVASVIEKSEDGEDLMEKAKKNLSKLQKKMIINKKGKKQGVWVDVSGKPAKGEKGKSEVDEETEKFKNRNKEEKPAEKEAKKKVGKKHKPLKGGYEGQVGRDIHKHQADQKKKVEAVGAKPSGRSVRIETVRALRAASGNKSLRHSAVKGAVIKDGKVVALKTEDGTHKLKGELSAEANAKLVKRFGGTKTEKVQAIKKEAKKEEPKEKVSNKKSLGKFKHDDGTLHDKPQESKIFTDLKKKYGLSESKIGKYHNEFKKTVKGDGETPAAVLFEKFVEKKEGKYSSYKDAAMTIIAGDSKKMINLVNTNKDLKKNLDDLSAALDKFHKLNPAIDVLSDEFRKNRLSKNYLDKKGGAEIKKQEKIAEKLLNENTYTSGGDVGGKRPNSAEKKPNVATASATEGKGSKKSELLKEKDKKDPKMFATFELAKKEAMKSNKTMHYRDTYGRKIFVNSKGEKMNDWGDQSPAEAKAEQKKADLKSGSVKFPGIEKEFSEREYLNAIGHVTATKYGGSRSNFEEDMSGFKEDINRHLSGKPWKNKFYGDVYERLMKVGGVKKKK